MPFNKETKPNQTKKSSYSKKKVLRNTKKKKKKKRNSPEYQGSISGRVIPKTQKLVLDAALLNTQHYMQCIKGKVDQFWYRSCAFPYTSV